MKRLTFRAGFFLLATALMAGCQTLPKEALSLSPEALQEREMQTRVYDGLTEEKILTAATHIIQDLGATITESDSGLGVIIGEKSRDATEVGQVVAAVLIAALGGGAAAIDKNQKIRFAVVTAPVKYGHDDDRYFVRLTVQRIVWNTNNQISRIETIRDPEIYGQFFEKLDKAIFLEKHS